MTILILLALAAPQDAVEQILKVLHGKALKCEDALFEKVQKAGAAAVPALSKEVDKAPASSGRDWYRGNLLHALGHVGSDDAYAIVRKLADSADASLRAEAFTALGHFDKPEVRAGVVGLLATEKDPTALGQAAWAAGHLKEKSAIDALLGLVEKGPLAVPYSALGALEEIGDASAIPRLAELYKTVKGAALKATIATTLASLGSQEIQPELDRLLDSGSDSEKFCVGNYLLHKGSLRGAEPYLARIGGDDREAALINYEMLRISIPDLPAVTIEKKVPEDVPPESRAAFTKRLLPAEEARRVLDWFAGHKDKMAFDKDRKVFKLK